MMDIEILVRADTAISSYGISEHELNQDQSLRQTPSWKNSKKKIIRNLIIVSFCSMLVQSLRQDFFKNQVSFQILQLAQQTFKNLSIDQCSIESINFIFIFLNTIIVPQIIISRLSSKNAILISLASYFVIYATNLFNSNKMHVIGK